MRFAPTDFIERVRELYIRDPARVSSVAFWKLETFLRRSDTYRARINGQEHLWAITDNRLLFYWSTQADALLLDRRELRQLDFLVLHEDFYHLVQSELSANHDASPSHVLLYDFSHPLTGETNANYTVTDFDFADDREYARAAQLIAATSTAYPVTADRVRQWTQTSAFDATLWAWARDCQTGESVGIGVSNHDARIPETELDWFFVLPAHQGREVGRLLVEETARRDLGKSPVIRVAGIADGFYMKCGFQRKDRWYVIRKR